MVKSDCCGGWGGKVLTKESAVCHHGREESEKFCRQLSYGLTLVVSLGPIPIHKFYVYCRFLFIFILFLKGLVPTLLQTPGEGQVGLPDLALGGLPLLSGK